MGRKHQVKNDALDFTTVELRIDGKFVGFVYENAVPTKFSDNYYAYATCPVDKKTHEPDGYCVNWQIFDLKEKRQIPLTLPGLTVFSVPSFSWPYIAYVKAPDQITREDFDRGAVEVSCVVVEWPAKNVVAESKAQVNPGNFETDAPGSFNPPSFSQGKDSLEVTCSEFQGGDISTVTIPANSR